jgi:hypothetical protein
VDRSAVHPTQGGITLAHGYAPFNVRAMLQVSNFVFKGSSPKSRPNPLSPDRLVFNFNQPSNHGDRATVTPFIPSGRLSPLTHCSFLLDKRCVEPPVAAAVSPHLAQSRQPPHPPNPKGRGILPGSLRQDPLVRQPNNSSNGQRACIRTRASDRVSNMTRRWFGVGSPR